MNKYNIQKKILSEQLQKVEPHQLTKDTKQTLQNTSITVLIQPDSQTYDSAQEFYFTLSK